MGRALKLTNYYTADFETTVDENDCRVWATGIYCIGTEKFSYGNNIDFLFDFFETVKSATLYFHNLKFDAAFIFCEMLKRGYIHTDEKITLNSNEYNFSTLIDGKGMFYEIKIRTNNGVITINDSLKKIPLPIEKIPKAFGLSALKGDIDYKAYREPGHILTDEEVDYLENDVKIAGQALAKLFSQGLTKMTQGADALANYKETITSKKFDKYFPVLPLEVDRDIRNSYRGGWTYAQESEAGKPQGEGIVLDVNSLYPSVMYYCMLPYGTPKLFKGEYEYDELYPLYTISFSCTFELKEKHLPTIQLKGTTFSPTEFLKDSGDEIVTMTLTSVDYKLFLDNYNVDIIEFFGGYKFKQHDMFFRDYIDYWTQIKIQATIDGNEGLRTIAKLMLNSLYGKFGSSTVATSKFPTLEDDKVKYVEGLTETKNPIYIPMATFITAYARDKTIRSAQAVYDRFLYADTDSLHLRGLEVPNLEIHDTKLGAWKLENTFARGKFIRAKSYIEEIENKKGELELHVTCAGMPKQCHKSVTWDNFKAGSKFPGKLRPKMCKGGIVLVDCDFTIKL